MNSNSTSCMSSSAFGMPSKTLLRYVKALSWLILTNAAKAFLLQVASVSVSRNVASSSGASGIRLSECWKMAATAKTAFFVRRHDDVRDRIERRIGEAR
jgi:hypothetical protein